VCSPVPALLIGYQHAREFFQFVGNAGARLIAAIKTIGKVE
jgi:hypothetical protein